MFIILKSYLIIKKILFSISITIFYFSIMYFLLFLYWSVSPALCLCNSNTCISTSRINKGSFNLTLSLNIPSIQTAVLFCVCFFTFCTNKALPTVHTQSTLSDGHHLPSVCCSQLPQSWDVLRLSVLLKLAAAGGMAADRAEELICKKRGHVTASRLSHLIDTLFHNVRLSQPLLPLVSASLRASLLSSRFPPVIINCNKATTFLKNSDANMLVLSRFNVYHVHLLRLAC